MDEAAREWRSLAETDLDTARYNYEGEKFPYAAFLCQQAAERPLKAVYIDEFDENLHTHNLVRLARHVDAPDRIVDAAATLTQLYVETRYPDSFVEYTADDVETFIELATEVL